MSGEVIIVGMGPGPLKFLTKEAEKELLEAGQVFFRMSGHPVFNWLRQKKVDCVSFDYLYNLPGITYDRVYRTINQALVKTARKEGKAVYALPGNPWVFERTPEWLGPMCEEAGLGLRVVAGLSFLEQLYIELQIDPHDGVQILNAMAFVQWGEYPFTEKLGLLIGQVGLPGSLSPGDETSNVKVLVDALLDKFPPDHEVTLVWSTGMPVYEMRTAKVRLGTLPEMKDFTRHLATLWVPPLKPPWEFTEKFKNQNK